MKLLIQPGAGVAALVQAINAAKTSIEVLIFRFDRIEVEAALIKAVSRGVSVRALIAYTNRGGEKSLRALEMRLLAVGVTVARTADDLIRYHGKMMIVDERELYVMAFNFTNLDIERSRSFAFVTEHKETVREALKLFNADSKRVAYSSGLDTFVVSPVNSRKILSEFIRAAKSDLLIYDPAVTDPAIIRLLEASVKAGVQVRILGKLGQKLPQAEVHPLFMRLHSRTIIRDGKDVFLGSQSLRTAELDERREVGLIVHEPKIAARMIQVFEEDWKLSRNLKEEKAKNKDDGADASQSAPPPRKVAKKVAKTVASILPPVTPVLEGIVRELAGPDGPIDVNPEEFEATVRDAVREAVQQAVASAVEQASRQTE